MNCYHLYLIDYFVKKGIIFLIIIDHNMNIICQHHLKITFEFKMSIHMKTAYMKQMHNAHHSVNVFSCHSRFIIQSRLRTVIQAISLIRLFMRNDEK